MKHPKELEKIIKGFANNWRIRILELLFQHPGLTLAEICEDLKINIKTTSEHTKKLVSAGLIYKKYSSTSVTHTLTNRGKAILKFCRILE